MLAETRLWSQGLLSDLQQKGVNGRPRQSSSTQAQRYKAPSKGG